MMDEKINEGMMNARSPVDLVFEQRPMSRARAQRAQCLSCHCVLSRTQEG